MNNNEAYPEMDPQSQRIIEDLAASMREDEAFAEYTTDRETELQMYIEQRRAHLKIFIEERQLYRQMYIEERQKRLKKERKEARFSLFMSQVMIVLVVAFFVYIVCKYCV
ncbi:uncharacterized protein EAF02_005770 [Botrytis sinoallii]|uniref:uncharacterized protein n=1 Tax=Botrytis sinoallii TaxID=1463999 RepID=UPI0018FFF4ED|nr:uncharacterized protein EAF02_005770 [Botrytis sinoallii]KAF7882407.1 hypothetical protein EAF02_005770 [Botrytis sinoallii]